MDANERFENLAAQFYFDTGVLAPGKDEAEPGAHTLEERIVLWKNWLKEKK